MRWFTFTIRISYFIVMIISYLSLIEVQYWSCYSLTRRDLRGRNQGASGYAIGLLAKCPEINPNQATELLHVTFSSSDGEGALAAFR